MNVKLYLFQCWSINQTQNPEQILRNLDIEVRNCEALKKVENNSMFMWF